MMAVPSEPGMTVFAWRPLVSVATHSGVLNKVILLIDFERLSERAASLIFGHLATGLQCDMKNNKF